MNFNSDGAQIITGSFDHTTKVWDVMTGQCLHTLSGHRGEISSTQFNFSGELCISGSIDRTCKVWNVQTGQWCARAKPGPPHAPRARARP